MTTDIRRIASRIPLEVINEADFDLLGELLATNFVDHAPRRSVPPTLNEAGITTFTIELTEGDPVSPHGPGATPARAEFPGAGPERG
jgi:hypothetical protein